MLGCGAAGTLYGLMSGQPVLIAASSGPLLVFEEAVYEVRNMYLNLNS